MKTFSQPLSAKDEAVYLGRLKTGSERERGEAKGILVERNLRLVAHIAKKYQNVDEDMEDLISIGTIGLIKAIDSFDAGKGKLSTYASRCIDNELLMLLRAKKKTSREVSLYEPIGTDREGNEISLLDVIEQDQVDVVDRMEVEDKLHRLTDLIADRLSDREREIIIFAVRPWERQRDYPAGNRPQAWHFQKLCIQNREKGVGKAEGGIRGLWHGVTPDWRGKDNAFCKERRFKDRNETGASYL